MTPTDPTKEPPVPDPDDTQPEPEHHEGTLDLSGEGNEEEKSD